MTVGLVSHVNRDDDLIEAWVQHYLRLGVTSFHLVVHGGREQNRTLYAIRSRYPIAIVDAYEGPFHVFEKRDRLMRALSLVGAASCHAARDPRGGDAANHDFDGIFALSGAGVSARGDLGTCQIQDVGVSVLALLGVAAPGDWLGADRSGAA